MPQDFTIFFSIIMHIVENYGQSVRDISIENRMKASAFRDRWARVMFFKFSKLHEPQASAI